MSSYLRVSLVIPAYNARAFIARALESVERQSRPPDEIIVIDDGSKDGTDLEVIKFARSSRLIINLVRTPNRGTPAARNTGIAHSSGEIIAMLDADDVLYATFLEQGMRAFEDHPAWAVFFSDRDIVDSDGRFLGKDLACDAFQSLGKRRIDGNLVELLEEGLFQKTLYGSAIPMTCMFRRSALNSVGGFDESLAYGDDRLLMLRLMQIGAKFGYVDEALGTWQRHENNKTASKNLLARCPSSWAILDKARSHQIPLGMDPQTERAFHNAYCQLARSWTYAASRTGSNDTVALCMRFLRAGQLGVWRCAKALMRYGFVRAHNGFCRVFTSNRITPNTF